MLFRSGTNHTISNLTVTQYSTGKIAKDKSGSKDEVRAAGLFGIVYDDFTIKDLKLYESFVKVSGSSGIKVHAAAVAGFFGSSAGDTHSVSNITNVECTDCTVSADGNAGMFAGQVKLADNIGTSKDGKDGGTPIADGVFITDCRAYLSDDNSDEYYQLESGDERNYYVKSSASSAGGIAGYVEYGNLELDDSFSAVNVYAQMNAGGLVGASNDKLYIFNCYSSCDITSVSETGSGAGGILGKFGRGWIKIDNCFTTCDIYANCYSGGAFGFFTGSRLYKSATVRVKNTYSYGAVTWRNREICTLDENMVQGESFSGGFIGRIDKSLLSLDSSALDMRDHCYYLCMRGYNNKPNFYKLLTI